MLYPKNFEEKIGFDKIRELLKAECSGTIGQGFVDKIRFSDRFDIIQKLTGQTEEFRKIISAGENFPNSHYLDVESSLQKASIENSFLTEEEFFDIKLSLGTLFKALEFLDKKDEKVFPYLKELSAGVTLNKSLLKDIERIIDDRGKIKDDASPELRTIRASIISEQSKLRRKLDQILRTLKSQGIIGEDTSLTIREGRMVIPLGAEYKRRIKGFIHDTSASGQTVFIEPEEALDINNEVRELEYEERREIVRILTRLTDRVRPEVPALKKGYFFLGLIDFVRAKARFAINVNGIQPELVKKPFLDWRNTSHTVLLHNFQKLGKSVVPLNIRLDENNRVLLISGPNAGGKSVCLKTVGLTQYMLQCGLLVPMEEGSRAGIFESMFIDIGDEQSLENDLSTYSSHLKNMRQFLQFADAKSLCLIDEFGTGTEPQFGGAIAEAVLEGLHQRKVFGVITTHYTNLKFYAENTPGVINGAMRFDTEHLEPLFQLEIGKPGSSFALEIAQKIGLPREVTAKARQKLGKEKIDVEKLLRDLEVEKKFYRAKNEELAEAQKQLDKTLAEYNKLKDFVATNRKQLLNEAKAEAKALLRDANQQIENAIREIKETKADKEQTKEVRKKLDTYKNNLKPEVINTPVDDKKSSNDEDEIEEIGGEISVGDYVKLDNNAVGEVLAMRGKDVTVRIGELKSTVKLNRLVRISRKEYRQVAPKTTYSNSGIDLNAKMMEFSFELDVRGNRAEEALPKVDQFIDNAIMLSHNELRIVHGKGDGILRTVIREHLKRVKAVRSMEDEHADRGGAGVTVVTLR